MKKNGFMDGAIVATIAIFVTKILGILYVIPFYKIVGEQGGALYGYAYNIYNIFLIISSAGIPLAISKITSEYITKKEYQKKDIMYSVSKKIINIFSILSFLICFIFAKQIAHLILGNLTGGNSIEDVAYVIRCISFALLVVPLLSISRGFLQGHKYIAASSFSQVIEQFVRIIIIIVGSFLTLKIFHLSLTMAVGVAVFAAAIGAIVAYIYLYFKMKKADKVNKIKYKDISKEDKKEVLAKIIGYSIPFIIINIANSLYNTTDMILVIRGLTKLGYSASDIETISSVFTTWGDKLGNIVRAVATGLTISLIPSIVSAFVKKDTNTVNSYFNKILQVLLYIIFPITVIMSIFSKEVWYIFYGESYYGPIIFRFTILVVLLDSAYILIGSALQGLYKTKLIYTSVAIGLITNVLLDLPLMFLFNKLGIYPYYGAITSTIICYILALGIPLIYLAKKDGFNYSDTIKKIPKIIITVIIIAIVCLLYKKYIILPKGYIYNLIYLGIIGILSLAIHFIINGKEIIVLLELKFKKKVK